MNQNEKNAIITVDLVQVENLIDSHTIGSKHYNNLEIFFEFLKR